MILLGGLEDLSGLDAVGTNLHTLSTTLRQLHTNRLQVWVKPAGRPVVRMGYVISKLRAFATNFATLSHYLKTSRVLT